MTGPGRAAVREKRSRAALAATLGAIDALATRRPLAVAIADALTAAGKLGPKERRVVATLSRGVARQLRVVDLCLEHAGRALGKPVVVPPADRSLLRLAAYLVAVRGEERADVLKDLALPGPRRPRSVDDRRLSVICAALPRPAELPVPEEPLRALAQRRSVPDQLARRLVDGLGLEEADLLLAGLNEEPRLDLRANLGKTTRDGLVRLLGEEGIASFPLAHAAHGVRVDDRAGLFGRLHERGFFELQDEGSQLLVQLCGAQQGQTALDACAGAGGKALALAAEVGAKGRVLACDADARRLAELPKRSRRAGAGRIVQLCGAAPGPEHEGRCDVVLVDAPCSGIGGLRREPDLRWRLDAAKLDALPALQLSILRSAARFVAPEGALVYGTCSPLPAEDEQVVERFLAEEPGFRLTPAVAHVPAAVCTPDGRFLRVTPHRHGAGAFFGARLTRVKSVESAP